MRLSFFLSSAGVGLSLLVAFGCGSSGDEPKTSAASTGSASTGTSSTGTSSTGTSSTGTSTTGTSSTGTSGSGGAGGSSGTTGSGGAGQVVRIIAIGDTGEGNAEQGLVADKMSEKCGAVGGCDFVMVNGDNFYDHGVTDAFDPQWVAKFETPYDRPNLNGLPFYPVFGNHDYGPTSNGDKQAQLDYATLPVGNGPGMRLSDKWTMPDAFYDVQVGGVHIFAIDTIDYSNSAAEADMAAKVGASNATWKIVFAHHPRFTSGDHYFDNQLLGFSGLYDFQSAIYCQADMFMTGHDHNREVIDKGRDSNCPDTYFVISGAGAKVREASSLVPTDQDQLYYDDTTEGFAYLEFSGNTMHFEFIDKFGVVNYTLDYTK